MTRVILRKKQKSLELEELPAYRNIQGDCHLEVLTLLDHATLHQFEALGEESPLIVSLAPERLYDEVRSPLHRGCLTSPPSPKSSLWGNFAAQATVEGLLKIVEEEEWMKSSAKERSKTSTS